MCKYVMCVECGCGLEIRGGTPHETNIHGAIRVENYKWRDKGECGRGNCGQRSIGTMDVSVCQGHVNLIEMFDDMSYMRNV